jgi:hypothetical protein
MNACVTVEDKISSSGFVFRSLRQIFFILVSGAKQTFSKWRICAAVGEEVGYLLDVLSFCIILSSVFVGRVSLLIGPE